MMTGNPGYEAWISWKSAMPSIPSILRSVRTRSGRFAAIEASARWPLSIAVTS
jgi:hypothetical protein